MAERTTVSDSEGEKRKSSNDSERASDNDNNNNIGGGIKNKSTETATAHSPTFPQSDCRERCGIYSGTLQFWDSCVGNAFIPSTGSRVGEDTFEMYLRYRCHS